MVGEFSVTTRSRTELVDITCEVTNIVRASGIDEGICVVYIPHTTAAVTINENADPSVTADIIHSLDKIIPWNDPAYTHMEGNSAAHVKSSFLGCSASVIVKEGKLLLGVWQGVYFCAFDGPRERKVYARVSS